MSEGGSPSFKSSVAVDGIEQIVADKSPSIRTAKLGRLDRQFALTVVTPELPLTLYTSDETLFDSWEEALRTLQEKVHMHTLLVALYKWTYSSPSPRHCLLQASAPLPVHASIPEQQQHEEECIPTFTRSSSNVSQCALWGGAGNTLACH